ncbi:MAG TPA: condensation domain-containing protein, partial [Thermoanaerobaculia bacterium]|nr:condensation domain-containing protein [Thermoanaerobaculia bacterium]
ARQDGTAERFLAAYVVPAAPAAAPPPAAEALRAYLRERLPDAMVPATFTLLDELPLTPNRKVDRKALPAPRWAGGGKGQVAPRTPTEEVLAGIWAELLGRETVSVADSFFELGGHSLMAIRLTSRLRRVFGVEMPLRDLFTAPRLADLAARVDEVRRSGATAPAPPLLPVAGDGPRPLSFAQQRLWFIDQLEPGSPLYNMPVALRVEGPLDPAVLALCLGEILRRHQALRTVFATVAGSPVQWVRPWVRPVARFPVPVVDLSALPAARREPAARGLLPAETARPFDLARGPLLRCLVLRLGEREHAVALTTHHIASDGWSRSILVREIVALYPAIKREGGTHPPSPRSPRPAGSAGNGGFAGLPELPVQYADFAAWQRSWLQGETLAAEIAFWRRQLAGLPPLLELPTDRPRLAVQSFRGASRSMWLPAGLTRQLLALARREGATPFMVLLAGFEALLARTTGQDDFAVGSPVAGRNRVEIEDLVGFFVNTLVLRGDVSGAPSFAELLGRVRDTALLAYVHQDLPFEKLVEELAPERSLAHTPLFQVMFALQNFPAARLDLADLSIRPAALPEARARFELELTFAEAAGELSLALGFAADLFDPATVLRLAGQLLVLLAAGAADAGRPVRDLPVLSDGERHQLRAEWNDTAAPPAPGVIERFAAQARRRPEAAAVAVAGDPEGSLSYRAL